MLCDSYACHFDINLGNVSMNYVSPLEIDEDTYAWMGSLVVDYSVHMHVQVVPYTLSHLEIS